MNIEIAEPGRMTQSGSSLLKLIQNNNMPILDLFVRESIQNSLDASRFNSEYVNVEFIKGEFITKNLNKELVGIEEGLNTKFNSYTSKFLAVKDSNTVGLIGKLHYDDVEDNDYGNLLKLVYEISKPQESPGAGGSWGLGKTVYFRIGIGLVIYYSRILNDNNEYESRFAITLVEDEKNEDSLIPPYQGKAKRGIAWWGDKIGDNKTKPITDDKEILRILKIFSIKPYLGDETGTTIIIPYIDEQLLLGSNKSVTEDNNIRELEPYWYENIEDYLKIAVQRWYMPRLNNDKYTYGKWLRVLINDQGVSNEDIEPIFQLIRELYNCAIDEKYNVNKNICNTAIKREPIKLRNVLSKSESGVLTFTKVNKSQLKMLPPYNKKNPYVYINQDGVDGDQNKPIILYTRRPGMIVSYEITGKWVDKIPLTSPDEYIIGIYVLNSNNKVTKYDEEFTLEEYIRKSEMADHTSWSDWSYKNINLNILSKIQGHINSIIYNFFKEDEQVGTKKFNGGLGKLLGDKLLPPIGFGRKASTKPSGSSGSTTVSKGNGASLKIYEKLTTFSEEGVNIKFHVKALENITNLTVEVGIATENGKITANEWENILLKELPFKVSTIKIENLKKDKQEVATNIILNSDSNEAKILNLNFEMINSKRGSQYGFMITSNDNLKYEVEGIITIKALEKGIRTVLNMSTSEGDK